jgi:hypothetical protein
MRGKVVRCCKVAPSHLHRSLELDSSNRDVVPFSHGRSAINLLGGLDHIRKVLEVFGFRRCYEQ